MNVTLPGPLAEPPHIFFRRCGYHPSPGQRGEEAYARRIGSLEYPRFHLYIHGSRDQGVSFRIHLDQKRPSYAGSHAHGADYEGPQVASEVERVRRLAAAARAAGD